MLQQIQQSNSWPLCRTSPLIHNQHKVLVSHSALVNLIESNQNTGESPYSQWKKVVIHDSCCERVPTPACVRHPISLPHLTALEKASIEPPSQYITMQNQEPSSQFLFFVYLFFIIFLSVCLLRSVSWFVLAAFHKSCPAFRGELLA